jgi:hypothetical protein
MEHKAVQFEVVQTIDPCCWKWIVFLNATRMRAGIALTRADAVLDAELAIEKYVHRPRNVLGTKKAIRAAHTEAFRRI